MLWRHRVGTPRDRVLRLLSYGDSVLVELPIPALSRQQRALPDQSAGTQDPRVLSDRMTAYEAHDHEECRRGAETALSGL